MKEVSNEEAEAMLARGELPPLPSGDWLGLNKLLPKERGIIMSGDNPKLILDGRKTQTRRIIKPQPDLNGYWRSGSTMKPFESKVQSFDCPYGVAGDRLWVRENHKITRWGMVKGYSFIELSGFYLSDDFFFRVILSSEESVKFARWKRKTGNFPSIFMFRSLSRITLEITKVRAERLQDISEEDARAEGVDPKPISNVNASAVRNRIYRDAYAIFWNSLHGKGAWDKNPWVWVLEFKRI